jgi:ABC-type uncharacterized transport system substrate-binding protein
MRKAGLLSILVLLAIAVIAGAQQPVKVAKVGWLSSTFPRSFGPYQAMLDELRKLGYSEGQNLLFEFRSAEGNAARLPELAAEIIRARVDLLIAPGPEATLKAAKQASATTPIVMVAVDYDPIARGYITGLARPGGNITGLFFRQLELGTKRIELLKDTLPEVSRIAVFWDRFSADQLKDIEITAQPLGVRLQPVEIGNPTYDFQSAFKVMTQGRAGALLLLASPVFHTLVVLILAVIAYAQQPKKVPRIGYLSLASQPGRREESFIQGLRDLGWIRFQPLMLRSPEEIEGAFSVITKERSGALIVQPTFYSTSWPRPEDSRTSYKASAANSL